MSWYSEFDLRPLALELDVDELNVLFKDIKVVGLTGVTGRVCEVKYERRCHWIIIEWDHHDRISSVEIEDYLYREKPTSIMFLISDDRMNMVKNGFVSGVWWSYKHKLA